MEKIIEKIISLHSDIFTTSPNVEKINAGFTNKVFNINNKYILKICTNIKNENAFITEIEFYKKNNDNDNIPKLINYDISKEEVPYIYEILEKLDGVSLYTVWPDFDEEERENIIKQLCDILKEFHKNHGEPYDWAEYIKHHVEKYLQKIDGNLFSKEEKELIKLAISKFDKYLKSTSFVFTHNDIHFDNIIYKNGKIKVIDFERSLNAPIDKELDIFFRMVDMPWKYANEDVEKFVKKEDYKNIKSYVQKYYPEILNIPNLDMRLAIYDLRDFLRAYSFYQSEIELKEIILNKARYIVSK